MLYSHRIGTQLRIAAHLTRHLGLGKFPLHANYIIPNTLLSFGVVANKLHYPLHILLISLHDFGITLILLQIIVAVAEAETRFAEMENVHVGVERVGTHTRAEERAVGNTSVQPCQIPGQVLFLEFLCLLDIRHYGRCSFLVQTDAIHAQSINVAYLLGYGALLFAFRVRCKTCDKFFEPCTVVFGHHVKDAETRILARQRVRFFPATVGIHIKISAGSHCSIHVCHIDAVAARCCGIDCERHYHQRAYQHVFEIHILHSY